MSGLPIKRYGAVIAAVAVSAATFASGQAFQIVPSPCPAGMVYLSEAEAQQQSATICAQIGQWAIVEVGRHAGPGLSGSGYQCNFDPTSCQSSCTESVCKPGTGGEGDGGDSEAVPELWAILTFVFLSLYVVMGVAYQYHTRAEITHPHLKNWKQVVGLVQDGFAFSKAKYSGEEYKGYDRLAGTGEDKPVPFVPDPAGPQVPPPARPTGPARAATARAPQNLRATGPPARATPVEEASSPPKKKKKKKKNPGPELLEDSTAPAGEVKKKKKKKKKPAVDAEAKE